MLDSTGWWVQFPRPCGWRKWRCHHLNLRPHLYNLQFRCRFHNYPPQTPETVYGSKAFDSLATLTQRSTLWAHSNPNLYLVQWRGDDIIRYRPEDWVNLVCIERNRCMPHRQNAGGGISKMLTKDGTSWCRQWPSWAERLWVWHGRYFCLLCLNLLRNFWTSRASFTQGYQIRWVFHGLSPRTVEKLLYLTSVSLEIIWPSDGKSSFADYISLPVSPNFCLYLFCGSTSSVDNRVRLRYLFNLGPMIILDCSGLTGRRKVRPSPVSWHPRVCRVRSI